MDSLFRLVLDVEELARFAARLAWQARWALIVWGWLLLFVKLGII